MIPAHHTESKILSAMQGRMALWRLQRNSINLSWIFVWRSRAIHQLGYGPLPQCSDLVANGGILLQKSKVAGRLIFREITKREAIADLYSLTHISEVACEFNVRR